MFPIIPSGINLRAGIGSTQRQRKTLTRVGFEPTTFGFDHCSSTNWTVHARMRADCVYLGLVANWEHHLTVVLGLTSTYINISIRKVHKFQEAGLQRWTNSFKKSENFALVCHFGQIKIKPTLFLPLYWKVGLEGPLFVLALHSMQDYCNIYNYYKFTSFHW